MSAALELDDLIAAPASAAGSAARSIVRVSGDCCGAAVRAVFTPDDDGRWTAPAAARHLGRLRLTSPELSLRAAAYVWPTRRSFTGQPTVELHLPGAPPLVEATLTELDRQGVRPARPGEFTLRAFLAGRLDLAQAEAVLGVIDAADPRELELALRQLGGGLSGRIADVRADLLSLLADLEAGLDFVDEDIEFVSRAETVRRFEAAAAAVAALRADAADRVRSGGRRRVVLAGLPNAGKSTLFNALAGADAALVSPIAGTTRDWLATETDLAGVAVELVDTAGWETAADKLSAAMQRQRTGQLESADLIVWCSASMAERDDDARCRESLGPALGKTLVVATKADLVPDEARTAFAVSAATGDGLDALRTRIAADFASERAAGKMLGSTAARGRESLEAAADALARGLDAAALGFGDEVLAAELRAALDGLAAVVGAVYTDDVLDVIFSRFCIGK